MGLFETAVMALMTSLAIDMDLHDGKPRWGPPTFHDTINKVDKNKNGKTTPRRNYDEPNSARNRNTPKNIDPPNSARR